MDTDDQVKLVSGPSREMEFHSKKSIFRQFRALVSPFTKATVTFLYQCCPPDAFPLASQFVYISNELAL